MKGNLVKHWMTSDPITITSNVTIPEAYWLMIDNKIRRLLVVDDQQLVGIVTIEDLRQKIPFTTFAMDVVKANDVLTNCPISRVMSLNPKTTSPDIALVEAARLMLKYNISTLPVMEREKLVGIITESDIFRAFVQMVDQSV